MAPRCPCLMYVALFAVLVGCSDRAGEAEPGADAMADAARLHESVLVYDGRVDVGPGEEADRLDAGLQADLHKLRAGGVDAAVFRVHATSAVRDSKAEPGPIAALYPTLAALRRGLSVDHPDLVDVAAAPPDLDAAVQRGVIAAVVEVAGLPAGVDRASLADLHDLGVRIVAPLAADREEIAEMNRSGIVVDISDLTGDAILDAIRTSSAPAVAVGAIRALADDPANLDDAALVELGARGGVVVIPALEDRLKVQPPERAAALAELREATGFEGSTVGMSHEQKYQYDLGLQDLDRRFPRATVSDLVDHLDYAVHLIGVDHVGIGSAFDGGGGIVGWSDASQTSAVTHELVRRGYSREEIGLLWGRNLLRLWEDVERVGRAGGS